VTRHAETQHDEFIVFERRIAAGTGSVLSSVGPAIAHRSDPGESLPAHPPYDRGVLGWITRFLRRRGFYCPACGYTSKRIAPEGPHGFVYCPSCRSLGMRLFEREPRRIPCPFEGCLMKVWDDGGADPIASQHARHSGDSRGQS